MTNQGYLDEVLAGDGESPVEGTPSVEAPPVVEAAGGSGEVDPWADEQIPGVSRVSMGETVSRFPIDRLKFSAARRTRLAIISKNPMVLKVHYAPNHGSFLCFRDICCDVAGLPRVRYVFPVFVYETDSKGKVVPGLENRLSIKLLSVGEEQYNQLVAIHESLNESGKNITSADLIVACTDETYQSATYTVAGANQWRSFSPDVVTPLVDLWKKNQTTAYRAIARQLSKKDLMGSSAAEQPPATAGVGNMNLDDVLNR
jgi:hypothetical protein